MKVALPSNRYNQFANYIQRLRQRPDFTQTFMEAIEQAADPICLTDNEGHIEYVNPAFELVSGYTQAEALDNTLRLVKSGKHTTEFYRHMWEIIKAGKPFRQTMVNRSKTGQLFHVDETITPLKNTTGEVVKFLIIWRDITKRHRLENHIHHQAYHDPLTNLPNRNLLYDRLHTALKKAQRKHKQVAVLFIDLDKFKPINDTYGHDAGDTVLQIVAKRLQRSIREADTAARIGGGEFVVILEDISENNGVVKAVNLILNKLSKPSQWNKHTLKVSASIGISLFPIDAENTEALISKADQALHEAKKSGGGRFAFYNAVINT